MIGIYSLPYKLGLQIKISFLDVLIVCSLDKLKLKTQKLNKLNLKTFFLN